MSARRAKRSGRPAAPASAWRRRPQLARPGPELLVADVEVGLAHRSQRASAGPRAASAPAPSRGTCFPSMGQRRPARYPRAMKQRSQSVAHGAVRAPQARQRPMVGSSISARSSRTTRAAAFSSSAAAFSIVTPATPGYCSANQRRIDASRAAASASSRLAASRRRGSRIQRDHRALRPVARERAGERAEQRQPVLVDRRLHQLPDVRSARACGGCGGARPGPCRGARAAAGSTRPGASPRRVQ